MWSNSAIVTFVRDARGHVVERALSGAQADQLRAGNLYNAAGGLYNAVGDHYLATDAQYTDAIGLLEAALFSALPQAGEALVREFCCDHVITLAFMNDAHPGWIDVSIALYACAEDQHQTKGLERLHASLQPLVAHLMRNTQRRSFDAGMLNFLHRMPVGLVFLGWQLQVNFVNDEGCRQAHVWNTAPDTRPVKDPRKRFSIAEDLRSALGELAHEWVDALVRLEPPSRTQISVVHARVPELKAVVALTFDPNHPLTTPNFVIRFASVGFHATDAAFEPSDTQLSALGRLTPAERAVAILVMQGLDNKAIAEQLHREISTVKDHLTRVYAKLGLKSRTQLAGIRGLR